MFDRINDEGDTRPMVGVMVFGFLAIVGFLIYWVITWI
jgi:hypothetical protein